MTHILFQIWRWMMLPKVWRFVGFAAAVVGLLCNALSSSFSQFFGEWDMSLITIYTVISIMICVFILFAAKLWQHSRSHWFKVHTTYVILAVTSLYSYFFDKLMHKTPDAYSLISCASFAVTALSLSRNNIQCGFETDLLYFLLGCLMMQLMKITLKLFIFGAVFSYFLIILRSSFSLIDASGKKQDSEFQDGNSVVLNMDSLQLAMTDIGSMLEKLEARVKALEHGNSKSIQMVLEPVRKHEHSQLVMEDPSFKIDALKKETIKDLEETTNVMVRAGFVNNFFDVYNNSSRECIKECVMHMIFELAKPNFEDVHNMSWKDLDDEIEKWIRASNDSQPLLIFSRAKILRLLFLLQILNHY